MELEELEKLERKTEIEKEDWKELEKLKIERKFNELANHLSINLIKGSKKAILSIADYISKGENLKIESIGSSVKDKRIAYRSILLFGLLSPYSYLNISP